MREKGIHIIFIETRTWFTPHNRLRVMRLIKDRGPDKLDVDLTIKTNVRPFKNHRNGFIGVCTFICLPNIQRYIYLDYPR